MNKKLNPIKRRQNFENNQTYLNNDNFEQKVTNNFDNTLQEIRQDFKIPEFLKKIENEQYLQMYLRMRQRHMADGAVSLIVENDDLAEQNLDLYDNKGINLEPISINENMADHIEYYIESINREKFFKVSKSLFKSDEETKTVESQNIKRKETKKITEDILFLQFDEELSKIIIKTSEKVSLIFLFSQGLLAGISLVNILLLFQYIDYKTFLSNYSNNIREIFNFTHALTFGSLVGNGIKFISIYKRCIIF